MHAFFYDQRLNQPNVKKKKSYFIIILLLNYLQQYILYKIKYS